MLRVTLEDGTIATVRSVQGDLWQYFDGHPSSFVAVPTCGILNRHGRLVMESGVGAAASNRWPNLDEHLGALVAEYGHRPFVLSSFRVLSWPTRPARHQLPNAVAHPGTHCGTYSLRRECLSLAEHTTLSSARHVRWLLDAHHIPALFAPRLSCDASGLHWPALAAKLQPVCDDRVIIVIPEKELVIPEEELVVPEQELVVPQEELVIPPEELAVPPEELVAPPG